MKSLFSQIKFLQFQTLQKKGILRDYWKWILKFLKINIIQEKIIFYCKTNLNFISQSLNFSSKYKSKSLKIIKEDACERLFKKNRLELIV
jgi:hypothetical protein